MWQQRATDSDSERRSATASSVHKWEERAHRRGPSSSVHGCSLTKVTHPTTARAQAHSWHCLNTTTAGLARRARAHQGPTSPMAQAQFTALPHGQKALRAPARYHSTLSRGRERGRRRGRGGIRTHARVGAGQAGAKASQTMSRAGEGMGSPEEAQKSHIAWSGSQGKNRGKSRCRTAPLPPL